MINKSHSPSRRNFMKSAAISLPIISMSGIPWSGCISEEKSTLTEIFRLFKNPPPEARPFFRWWWNGNQLNKEEIARELKLMQTAGAGGIEINPIAMPRQINNPPEDGLVWLSDDWCEMVRYTVQEAKKNNMKVDLIVGTGWPFGGEFLDPDETIQGLTFEQHILHGPGQQTLMLKPEEDNEKIYKIYLIQSGLKQVDDMIELNQRPDSDNKLSMNLASNEFYLVIIRIKKGFREVFRGAPGGAGPVLDHFNAGAVSKYLNHLSDKLNPYFEGILGNGIRAMFCDSIELEGANWTSDFPIEFEKRRGYAIEPYLPLMLPEIEIDPGLIDQIQRARFDYSQTLAELFKERFIEIFYQWCRDNQVLSRYQAYGFPWLYTDLVEGNMITDIPEGDQWLYNPGWSSSVINGIRYAIWNKYASSGGHLAQRNIISSEAMTNTSGVFKATLKYMKQAADLNFVAGINHLVLHGFNYSPPEIPFPGWVQYGTYFNENNTWWPYVSAFMEYVSRISVVLQQSEPVSQVALLGPTPDIWRKYGLDRNPFNTEPWYLHSIWQAFSNHGISIDFINGHILTESAFENGRFDFDQMSYQALVVCSAESMEMPVARSILQYVETGGKVIFISDFPDKAPGMDNYQEFSDLVKSSIERAIDAGAHVEEPPEESLKGDMDQFAVWAGNFIENYQLKPGINIMKPDAHLMSVQFIHNQHPVLFFSNVHQSKFIGTVISYPVDEFDYWRWDPEKYTRVKLIPDENNAIELNFKPLESALIVLEHSDPKAKATETRIRRNELILEGAWELECIPKIAGANINKTLNYLVDLSTLPDLSSFSGTAIYRKSLSLEDPDYFELELGKVYDMAEVVINGKPLGIDWYGNKTFSLNGYLIKGKNELVIKVVNTLLNYCISQRNNPEIGYWLDRYREEAERTPCGLLGPVKLFG